MKAWKLNSDREDDSPFLSSELLLTIFLKQSWSNGFPVQAKFHTIHCYMTYLSGCVPLRRSRSRSVIRDHSDHGRLNEPKNPSPEWIHRFIWSTTIRVISDHWSWSGSIVSRESALRSYRFHIHCLQLFVSLISLVRLIRCESMGRVQGLCTVAICNNHRTL